MADEIEMRIVIDDGTVYRYKVKTISNAREHAHKIMTQGFRSDSPNGMKCYPVHRISHIEFNVPEGKEDELMHKYPAEPI